MYQIIFKGCFETEDADRFVQAIEKLAKDMNVDIIGTFNIYMLPPYVDYQKTDVTDPHN